MDPAALHRARPLRRWPAPDGSRAARRRARVCCAGTSHTARRSDPFERFAQQLALELPQLLQGGPEAYHAYAFATVRMVGAAYELAASSVEWLFGDRGARSAAPMRLIVDGCKVLGFRLARRREFDAGPLCESLREGWQAAMAALEGVVG